MRLFGTRNRGFWWGAAFAALGLLAGCTAQKDAAPPTSGDEVTSRGLGQAQRPMQPGMAQSARVRPDAAPRLPTFPQTFELQGPEVASFGFAVTQPGRVVVDAQAPGGGPLRVAIQSFGGQPITGSGHLEYDVTPADVQRTPFWIVQVALAQPPQSPLGGRVGVTLNMQAPPVDQAVVQRSAQAQLRAPTTQELDAARAGADAQINEATASSQMQFVQEQSRRMQVDRVRMQPMLDRMGGAQVRSRGLDSESGEVTSRAVPGPGVPTMKSQVMVPKDRMMTLPAEPPPPPPQPAPLRVTSVNEAIGGPGKVVIVNGTGFGPTLGQVLFTVPPNLVMPGNVTNWTDTEIGVEVPAITGVTPYRAMVYVQRGQELSNQVAFDFVPRQELRTIRALSDDRRHSGTVLTANIDGPRSQVMHVRIPGIPFSEFAGEKGNDEFFLRTSLKNGWTVSTARLLNSPINITISAAQAGSWQWLGSGYIQDQGSGANPYLNVRWWINPFTPFVQYSFLIDIVGPEGTPDGIVMP